MKLEAQICLQCGAMDWSALSKWYVGRFRVRKDGHIVFTERFEKIEYICNKCGSMDLLGIKGTPRLLSKLANLKPMQRILKALEYISDGKLATLSEIEPSDVIKCIERSRDHWESVCKYNMEVVEDFISRVKCIVGVWKLLKES